MMENQEGAGTAFSFNAIPWLAYWDIFKNYFANKQESNYYWVTTGQTVREFTVTAADGAHYYLINETIRILVSETVTIQANSSIISLHVHSGYTTVGYITTAQVSV